MLVCRRRITRIAVTAVLFVVAACGGTPPPSAVTDGPGSTLVEELILENSGDDFWDDSQSITPSGGTVQDSVERGGQTTLFVGDSILVSISDHLAARIDGNLVFDAANCRRLGQPVYGGCGGNTGTISSGLDAITDALGRIEGGQAPDVAVLILVGNSTVTADELDEAMDLLSQTPRVWWVNARIDGFGRQDLNNAALEELAERNPRARVIDWFSESFDPGIFSDHVHPNEVGQRRLARLIRDHLACDCVP